jgi:hypothetical protein
MAYRRSGKFAVLGLIAALALVGWAVITFGEDLLLRLPLP